MKRVVVMGVALVSVGAGLLASLLTKQLQAETQGAPYIKISQRPFNEREVRQVVPASYGRLVAATDIRLYFVDAEDNIRMIPLKSDSVLGNDVYMIKRSK
ncbi:MAG: hypothetical protein PHR44_03555 [Candidatus Omnitrophica bacterium]|nr:hypothetical protein [Candidatus Omnitrophota bacterium]